MYTMESVTAINSFFLHRSQRDKLMMCTCFDGVNKHYSFHVAAFDSFLKGKTETKIESECFAAE